MIGSDEQEAVWRFVTNDTGHGMVKAVAGSGKSTVLAEAGRRNQDSKPFESVAYLAFQKSNVLDMQLKAKGAFPVSTFHSLGNRALAASRFRYNRQGQVKNRMRDVIEALRSWSFQDRFLRDGTVELANFGRRYGVSSEDGLEALLDQHEFDFRNEAEEGEGIGLAVEALEYAAEPESFTDGIDFDDMLWLPFRHGLRLPRFDLLLVDECLIGNTPIMLGDGSNKTIKELVDTRYQGYVKSYDEPTGTTVNKLVTGWHRNPVTKRMVRVTTRRIGVDNNGNSMSDHATYIKYGNRYVVCTEDHKIFCDGQWRSAGNLRRGNRVVQESHSERDSAFTHRVKIGVAGKKRLSTLMAAKNETGDCGGYQTAKGVFRVLRGGNGRGYTRYQEALLEKLGAGWYGEHVVTLHKHPYKVDLANPERRLAVELDGPSHRNPKARERDRKKDRLLREAGWEVIRLSNKASVSLTQELLEERVVNSPVVAEVLAVEEWTPDDPYVYDITVEHTHNYYANGVVVHNCQDLSSVQHWFVTNAGERVLAVGDPRQAVYGWRAAEINSMDVLANKLGKYREFPLTLSQRCPRLHVEAAQSIVPEIRALPDAPYGSITQTGLTDYVNNVRPGDMTLCRLNAPLFEALAMLEADGRRAKVLGGGETERSLARMIRFNEKPTVTETLSNAAEWAGRKADQARAVGKEGRALRYEDDLASLTVLAAGVVTVEALKRRVRELGNEASGENVITLGTIHKQKGLEAGRVWIIGGDAIPHPYARKPWQVEQEYNLLYVAMTRGKGDAEIVFAGDVPNRMKPFVSRTKTVTETVTKVRPEKEETR